MTLILKSNQIVNDPDNRFPIITDQGEATHNVAVFKRNVENVGGSLTQQEFDALNILDKEITELGLQDAILDMNLAVGSNLNSKLIKFKGWKTNSLTPINSFDETNINSKGFVWNVAQGSGAKALGLGFTLNDIFNLPSGYQSIVYCNYNESVSNPEARTYMFGAGASTTFDNTSIAQYLMTGNGQVGARVFNTASTTVGFDGRSGSLLLLTEYNWNSAHQATYRSITNGQDKLAESTSLSQITAPSDLSKEVYLGALNGSVSVHNFFGEIGIFIFLDGNASTSQLLQLNNAINDFLTATGKNY